MSNRIDQIRQRLMIITPGPWSNTHIYNGEEVITGPQTTWAPNYIATAVRSTDAEFIAEAPTDMSWLLDEIERLQAEQRRLGVTVDVDGLRKLQTDHESAECGEDVSEEDE